jgi:hypothetical protein
MSDRSVALILAAWHLASFAVREAARDAVSHGIVIALSSENQKPATRKTSPKGGLDGVSFGLSLEPSS